MARQYWPDAVAAITNVDGEARLADKLDVYVAESGGYTFAMASSMFSCGTGSHGCPVSIYRDGEKVGEFSACQATDRHAISADGGMFFDCGNDEGRKIASLLQ